MAKKKYDVCYAQKDSKDQSKVYWKQIGVVLQTDKGFSMKLESVPVGWDGWAVLFEPKPKDASAKPAKADDMEGDVPF